MKNMLKVAVIIFTFSFVFELSCMAKENGIKNIAVYGDNTEIETKVERVEWRYRTYNGVRQKRLWSVTRSCWLTDWINC